MAKPLFYVWGLCKEGTIRSFIKSVRAKDGKEAVKKATRKKGLKGHFKAVPSGFEGQGQQTFFLTV